MIRCFLFAILFFLNIAVFSQSDTSRYWIQFTDKNNSPYSIGNPAEYLSDKAIQRRAKQGISIAENDLPVNPAYIDSIKSLGAKIINKSKWFNAVTISVPDSSVLSDILALSFVKSGKKVKFYKIPLKNSSAKKLNGELSPQEYFLKNDNGNIYTSNSVLTDYPDPDYGYSFNQINMVGGCYLHSLGYMGDGMTIAILDNGFTYADKLSAFDSLWNNNQILGTRDFVFTDSNNVFCSGTHGMYVLSIMAGNIPGEFTGTAPKAYYWLLRSEDPASENIIEEYNWVSAAEFADSVGADIINSSLGYSQFDNISQNHTYADLNGNTCAVTIGADIAASKGIIVVNSAGNSGNKPWKYIIAPADADSILAVGAVDSIGNYAVFSSTGPSYDGRTKPDVAAQGLLTYFVYSNGQITKGSGTSFAAPVITGMTACLWQSNINITNMQVIESILKSCSQYDNPDNYIGYGIPNFSLAKEIIDSYNIDDDGYFNVFPNPFANDIHIIFSSGSASSLTINLYDITGREVYSSVYSRNEGCNYYALNTLNYLRKGLYFLVINSGNKAYTKKIFKAM